MLTEFSVCCMSVEENSNLSFKRSAVREYIELYRRQAFLSIDRRSLEPFTTPRHLSAGELLDGARTHRALFVLGTLFYACRCLAPTQKGSWLNKLIYIRASVTLGVGCG